MVYSWTPKRMWESHSLLEISEIFHLHWDIRYRGISGRNKLVWFGCPTAQGGTLSRTTITLTLQPLLIFIGRRFPCFFGAFFFRFLRIVGVQRREKPWGGTSAERSRHERCFRGTNFLMKNAPKFSPNFWAFLAWVQKSPAKIPAKIPGKFLSQNQKNHRRASAGAGRRKTFSLGFPCFVGKKGTGWRVSANPPKIHSPIAHTKSYTEAREITGGKLFYLQLELSFLQLSFSAYNPLSAS